MSSLLLFLLFLCFILLVNNVSEASRHLNKKLPSAVVVGTVYCDTCFHQHLSNSNHFISGALVAVECGDSSASKPTFREEVKTDEKGEFKAHLPFSISKHVKKIEGCSVKLIRSSQPYCAVASTATSSTLHLKSKKQGTHIFSAGFFTFKPLNEPQLCNQKPSIKNSRDINSLASLIQNPDDLSFPPPLKDPPEPFLPPLPALPKLPSLPTLPLTPPGIIGPPLKSTPTSDELSNEKALGFPFPPNPFNPPSLFPPNPFLPPPSVLPPLPFQPPPSLIPPIFPSPPPSLFPPINFPPLPGLIPSPPPPPPSLLPPIFPRLPPFPFQPAPGFPGVPPASSTKKASP